jgi:hypothetical protein
MADHHIDVGAATGCAIGDALSTLYGSTCVSPLKSTPPVSRL